MHGSCAWVQHPRDALASPLPSMLSCLEGEWYRKDRFGGRHAGGYCSWARCSGGWPQGGLYLGEVVCERCLYDSGAGPWSSGG